MHATKSSYFIKIDYVILKRKKYVNLGSYSITSHENSNKLFRRGSASLLEVDASRSGASSNGWSLAVPPESTRSLERPVGFPTFTTAEERALEHFIRLKLSIICKGACRTRDLFYARLFVFTWFNMFIRRKYPLGWRLTLEFYSLSTYYIGPS